MDAIDELTKYRPPNKPLFIWNWGDEIAATAAAITLNWRGLRAASRPSRQGVMAVGLEWEPFAVVEMIAEKLRRTGAVGDDIWNTDPGNV